MATKSSGSRRTITPEAPMAAIIAAAAAPPALMKHLRIPPPNDKANLPGPRQGLHAARNENAAPVKLSDWFGRTPLQQKTISSFAHLPQLHGLIRPARGQLLAIRAEYHTPDAAGVRLERTQ